MEGSHTASVRATKAVRFGQRQVCEAKHYHLTYASWLLVHHIYNWKGWGVIPDILHQDTFRWKWKAFLLMNSVRVQQKFALKTRLLKFPDCGWINSKHSGVQWLILFHHFRFPYSSLPFEWKLRMYDARQGTHTTLTQSVFWCNNFGVHS